MTDPSPASDGVHTAGGGFRLYALSVRRPVLALVLSLLIVLFGVLGFGQLGVREYPSVDPPRITVQTTYVGADASVIEAQITQPMEESVNAVPGLRTLTSTSREGRSTVVAEFALGTDLETAANDVRDRAARAVRELPPDAEPPTVSKADADRSPIVFLNISSEQRSLLELSRIAANDFKPRLETIPGVSGVDIWGEKRPAMRLWLDPDRLAAYGLTAVDVRQALAQENVELPAGRIEGALIEMSVRAEGRLTTTEAFDDLVLREDAGRLVRLRDVGYAELGPENQRTVLRRDGTPMVGVVLRPQPGANQIDIADAFYERVAQIERDLPSDLKLGIGFDDSVFIRQSVSEVRQSLIIALTLVVLVIFTFLRDVRTTIIPAVVIPVSLVGVLGVLALAGYSLNVLTLLGLVLAIGLVVDDAIVVLENVYAKIERGLDPIRAGIEGTKEIFFAVIATTAVLIAVFLPLFFLGGLTGRLFREFALTLAGAVIISTFVALTLTPMLCSRLLRPRQRAPWVQRVTEPFFAALTAGYLRLLDGFLRVRWIAPLLLAAALGASMWLYRALPAELAPTEDRSSMRLSATAPEGASYDYMNDYMQRLEALVLDEVPERSAMISVTAPGFGARSSVNSGFVRVRLQDPATRARTQDAVAKDLERAVQQLPGARVFVSQPRAISGGRSRLPVQFVLQAPSFERLRAILPDFVEAAENDPTFSRVDVDLKFNRPELRIQIDRARARDLGVSARAIGETLQAGLAGQRFGEFLLEGRQYPVIGQLLRADRDEPLDLSRLQVRASDGQLVRLDSIAQLREAVAPPQIYRFNRYVSATVSAGLAPGATLGDGIAAMRALGARVLPEDFRTALDGPARDFEESASNLGGIFLLALLLVYLVLAAQFESFRDPLVIL
ncbi:MAG: efflux RND transporter permease subunit, partial [Acidobacteriota bacterium]